MAIHPVKRGRKGEVCQERSPCDVTRHQMIAPAWPKGMPEKGEAQAKSINPPLKNVNLQATIPFLQLKVVNLQATFPFLQLKIANLQGTIPFLQWKIVNPQAAIPFRQWNTVNLQAAFPFLQVQANDLQASFQVLQSKIADLHAPFRVLQSKIGELQALGLPWHCLRASPLLRPENPQPVERLQLDLRSALVQRHRATFPRSPDL